MTYIEIKPEARQGNRIETAAVNNCSQEIERTDSKENPPENLNFCVLFCYLFVCFFRFRERTYANNFLFASGLLCKSFVETEQKKAFVIPNSKTSKAMHIPFRHDDLLIKAAQLSALKTQNIWVLTVVLAIIKESPSS